MGKTLYLIKQTAPDTDASTNAQTVLNTVLDAIKDLSNSQVANLLTYSPDLSNQFAVLDYVSGIDNITLKNSDIYLDMFDQQYAALVSEYTKQTTWDGNDPSFNDGMVTHTYDIGYDPAVNETLTTVSSIDPGSAPLYDATVFVTTQEINEAYTPETDVSGRFHVLFDTTDGNNPQSYQLFKAVNSATYRSGGPGGVNTLRGTSGLSIEEVSFNSNAGLTEDIVQRGTDGELSAIPNEGDYTKLTDNNYSLTYVANDPNHIPDYGSFKIEFVDTSASVVVVQYDASSGVHHNQQTITNLDNLYISDQSGNSLLADMSGTQINNLYSDGVAAGYNISIENTSYGNNRGGYWFDINHTNKDSLNSVISITDENLLRNFDYMKTLTSHSAVDGSFVSQYFEWTNGTVTSNNSNVVIGGGAETLGVSDYNSDGSVIFYASDATYSSTSSNPQRSYPDASYNGDDLLDVNYTNVATYDVSYLLYETVEFETRMLLPATLSTILDVSFTNPYQQTLSAANSNNRYIGQGNNLVCIKSGNSSSMSADVFTFTATDRYHTGLNNDISETVTIFEIQSTRLFTNQSKTILEEGNVDGTYTQITGSSASIIASNVTASDATDYRFLMRPKSISSNSHGSGFNFPAFNNGFSLLAYDGSTYASTNKLETVKSKLNILGNNIYTILRNSYALELGVELKTNGTAINADSLKNYFEITYSANSGAIIGTHVIEDLDLITFDVDVPTDSSSVLVGTIGSDINTTGSLPTSMTGLKLYRVTETTVFSYARTQLHLGAYSNLYVETQDFTQVDTRYELRTSTGDLKPDFYLQYVNYSTNATRVLTATTGSLTNTITLAANDLKSHVGYIQYTEGAADNDDDTLWNNLTLKYDIDPNFDTANQMTEQDVGTFLVYIDVPKTYALTRDQYMIRMQLDPTATDVKGYTYPSTASMFTSNDYSWDLTQSEITDASRTEVTGLTVDYAIDEDSVATLTIKDNTGATLFTISHAGDITQSFRVIHAPRGVVETKVYLDGVLAETRKYHGKYNSSSPYRGLKYQLKADTGAGSNRDGITFRLDTRYRDTASTKSKWTLTNDIATLKRVDSNADYYDLSYQEIGVDGSFNLSYGDYDAPIYGYVSDGAKSVAFARFRGNALGTDSTVTINRTPSTLNYVMETEEGISTNGGYNSVYNGFSRTTVPSFTTAGGVTITDFGLRISNITYSILADGATTTYPLYVTYDRFTIIEENSGDQVNDPKAHDNTPSGLTVSAGDFYLWSFDGPNSVYNNWCSTVVKAPKYDDYSLAYGTVVGTVYYNSNFVGNPADIADNLWTTPPQGDSDIPYNAVYIDHGGEDQGGVTLNNGTIRLARTSASAVTLTGYFVVPPPQLKITAVVVNGLDYYNDASGTLQVYNPDDNGAYTLQSVWVDVYDDADYHPFVDYSDSGTNIFYMNDITVHDTYNQTISDYRYNANNTLYSNRVNIKENTFTIFEYSGVYSENLTSSPYHPAVKGVGDVTLADLTNGTLRDIAQTSNGVTSWGSVVFNNVTGSYRVNIKQGKGPLTETYTDRYRFENLRFTIGSAFLLQSGLDYYEEDETDNDGTRWVPTTALNSHRVMVFDFNVGNSTKLTLYGTNFSYNTTVSGGTKYTLTLKKYSTDFGVDYSNFPRELKSIYLYAKTKEYKQMTFEKPEQTRVDATTYSGLSTSQINAKLIYNELITHSWSDASYTWVEAGSPEDSSTDYVTNETAFTPGKIRFVMVPSATHVDDINDFADDVDVNYQSAGVKELLSILGVTEQEPRNILFMNLEDSNRQEGNIYGSYYPKTMTNYSGQTYAINVGPDRPDYFALKEKFDDTTDIYDTYGY